jgi:hypothetical protein
MPIQQTVHTLHTLDVCQTRNRPNDHAELGKEKINNYSCRLEISQYDRVVPDNHKYIVHAHVPETIAFTINH